MGTKSRQHDSGLEASETQQNEIPTSSLDLDKTDSSPKTDDNNDDGQSYSFPKLSISKIQINIGDKGKKAEEIISNITRSREKSTHGGETTRKKRKDTDGTINPQVLTSDVGDPGISESQSTGRDNSEVGTVTNRPLPGTSRQSVMDPADDNQNLSKTTLTELSLKQSVCERLNRHESGFHVKVFEIITPTVSQMSRAIESIIEPRQLSDVNQTRSYMIFFYRDKGGPEIFVAGSGMAYIYVDQRSCPEFPRKIARRLLEPTTIQLDTRNVTGDTSQVRKQYIPDKGGTINVWDIIEVVVHKYIAKPKDMASILQFFQKRPNKKPSIAIKKVSVEVITKIPDILVIQKIISHFATIDRNEPTYLFGTSQNKEEDDKTFAMFDLMQEEHNKEKIKTLQENMHRRIDRYIENQSEDDIQLSCDDLDLWLKTSECRLFLETESKWKPIKKWKECLPNFRDVLKALKEHIPKISGKLLSSDVKMSLHDDAGKTMKKKQPITNFIQSHFASPHSKPYYFWCGKWLKIKLEYFQMLDDSFMSIMKEQTIDSTHIMPLPWVYSHAKKTSKSKKVETERFAQENLCQFLRVFLPDQKKKAEDMEVLLKSVDGVEVEKNEAGIWCTYNQREYETKDQLKSFVQLFLTMNTGLTEGMYNDSYILFDKIISMTGKTSQTGFLVGDRMCIKNIEMFDIIMYNQTHTYIIHVKEGFDHNTRVVASQIRNSADILFRALTSHMTKTALEEMWESFTTEKQNPSGSKSQPTIGKLVEKEGMKKNYQAMKSKLDEMTKGGFIDLFRKREIVYVLAVRDKGEDRTFEIGDALETVLQRKYPIKCKRILHLLEEKMFIQKENSHYVVTDKFRFVKSKDQFVREMMDDTPDEEDNRLANEEERDDVDRIVSRTASRTGSASGNLTTGLVELEDTGHASISAESPERSLTGTEEASHRSSVLESCADDSSDSGLTNTEIGMEAGSSEEDTHSDVIELDPTGNIKLPANGQVSYNKAVGLDCQRLDEVLLGEVYQILIDQLPHTRSSIVKLDILSLFSHFRKYQIGRKRFQLKVCFVPKSTKTFGEKLKGFLEPGSLKK
ncbi:uncharacterized protein [Haliotis cracherodii]|uniref:uncharacterized protein n=1 Tax=Haliotis cracherodii TaxID=6455 RepID=UPI0039E79862